MTEPVENEAVEETAAEDGAMGTSGDHGDAEDGDEAALQGEVPA